MTKRESFLKDVMHEINSLRENATPEEKENLNFDYFDYTDATQCIYGQLTGSCTNLRAKELMDASCIRVMDIDGGVYSIANLSIEESRFNINGENKGQGWHYIEFMDTWTRKYSHLSSLEGYICTKDAKNAEIIAYIKGETNQLVL